MHEKETAHVLDTIMETMIDVVENSKIEIVHIIDTTRQEYETLYLELVAIKKESYKQANKVEQIKRGEELAKQRLSDGSRSEERREGKERRSRDTERAGKAEEETE